MNLPRSRRLAIVGSTASGKSSVALALAERLGTAELVSVDSMQVYRTMDIGTAKPTQAEQQRCPHHLIDLVDPHEPFTVAEFQPLFNEVVARIETNERVPVLVGGTGLYHRAVIDDLDLPGEWPEIRAELEAIAETEGNDPLYQRLSDLDPVAAKRIEPGNTRRTVRALEVCLGGSRRFSSYGPGLGHYPETNTIQFGLRWERARLTERIERRVYAMIDAGLVAEVAQIYAGDGFSKTAGQALGYKELIAHLDGKMSLDEAVQDVVVRTRQFAVRQERWFRRDPRVRWVDIHTDPVAEATDIMIEALRER